MIRRLTIAPPLTGLLACLSLVTSRAATAPVSLIANGGFEEDVAAGGKGYWSIDAGAQIEDGMAAEGRRCLRFGDKPGGARQTGIAVKPHMGYMARCRFRLVGGGAHYTFGMLQPDGTWFVCKDAYAGDIGVWDEIVLPFRTEAQTSLGLCVSKRYGQAQILFDAVELVEDDAVEVGDVSPCPNPFPTPTKKEQARGYFVSTQPWMELVYPTRYPTRGEIADEIHCRLSPGEAEPVAFSLTSLRPLTGVRVSLTGDLKSPQGGTIPAGNVEIRVVKTLTRWLTCSAPLKPGQRFERRPLFLFPNQPVSIAERETQEFWITVCAPQEARPGVYSGRLRLVTDGAPEGVLMLRVEVLPIRLAEPDVTYGMYHRHSEQLPENKTEGFFRQALRDMRAHGMNSMSVYADVESKKANGEYQVDLDYAANHYSLRKQMALLQEAGLASQDHLLLLLAAGKYDGCFWGEDKTLAAIQQEQRQRGWPEFLLYLVDEPGGAERIALAKSLNNVAHRVPGLRTTTAIGEPGELADHYDVWIVSSSVANLTAVKAFAQQKGKEVWTYDCVSNGNQPRNDRYFAGYHTWSAGLKGNWQWCYTEKGSGHVTAAGDIEVPNPTYEDPWYATFLISAPGSAIPTLGFEARREGVDDYRYLQTLKQCIAKTPKPTTRKTQQVLSEAQEFLKEVTRRTSRPSSPPMATYARRNYDSLMHPGLTVADYDAIRRRAVDLILQLGGRERK